jgi:hypothetical protein
MKSKDDISSNLLSLLGDNIRVFYPKNDIDHPALWIDGLFREIQLSIRSSDKMAIELACEFILKDPFLPFGKLIKSNLARELKKNFGIIPKKERSKIISTALKLLAMDFAPRELEDYAKLVAKFPKEEWFDDLEKISFRNNKAHQIGLYLKNSK